MKKLFVLSAALFVVFGLIPRANAAPQGGRDRDRVCFYQDIHYQGWEQCYSPGDEVANLGNRKNAFSSMRIYGRVRVTVYDNSEFRGRAAEFTSDVPDLGLRNLSGSQSWSDKIQSVRVSSGFNAAPPPPPPPPPQPQPQPPFGRPNQTAREGICVYDRPNFEGRSECWEAGYEVRDLARAGNWSDKISSIRVFGRAHVILFKDIGFNGEQLFIDSDIRDLSRMRAGNGRNWNNQISSFVIENERGPRGRGRGRGPRF